MSIACLQSEIDTGEKIATTFEKAESANSLPFAVYFHMGTHFCMGTYFCMGAYKHDVVVEIKVSAYIHGVHILCGCSLSRFYGSLILFSH